MRIFRPFIWMRARPPPSLMRSSKDASDLKGALYVYPRQVVRVYVEDLGGNGSDLPTVAGNLRLLTNTLHPCLRQKIEQAFSVFEHNSI